MLIASLDNTMTSRETAIRARALAAGIPEERAAGLASALVSVFSEPPAKRPWTIDPPTERWHAGMAHIHKVQARVTPRQPIPFQPHFDGDGEPESCALCGEATLYRTVLPQRSKAEQVPICPKCATSKTPADVPAKAGVTT